MVGSVICFSIMDTCVKWLDYYPIGQVLFLRFFIGFIPIFFIIPKDKLFSFYKTSRPGLHAFRAITIYITPITPDLSSKISVFFNEQPYELFDDLQSESLVINKYEHLMKRLDLSDIDEMLKNK